MASRAQRSAAFVGHDRWRRCIGAAGYATLSLSSVPFTGQYTNLHQGFEELHESASLPGAGTPLSAKTGREYVDRLLAWLERHRDVPFFAYLHIFDPHSPYEPYAPYNTKWSRPGAHGSPSPGACRHDEGDRRSLHASGRFADAGARW